MTKNVRLPENTKSKFRRFGLPAIAIGIIIAYGIYMTVTYGP